MGLYTNWRRKRIRGRPFPPEWDTILRRTFPRYVRLSQADREELQRHIQVFLAEKHFEGAGGLEMTLEIRVTIAAQACLLLLHRETDYYPGLYSIIVYPYEYVARARSRHESGAIVEGEQVRLGESSMRGAVVLSWDRARDGAGDVHDCHNLVFHEFAHQLDAEDGRMNGAPKLERPSEYIAWARVLEREYRRLRRQDLLWVRPALLDLYGATNPAEFFAVVTECFFQQPWMLRVRHPELYEELKLFFRQDPASEPRPGPMIEAPGASEPEV